MQLKSLKPSEGVHYLQAQIETGGDLASSVVHERVIDLYANPNAPYERGPIAKAVNHIWSGSGVIGCSCGGKDGCPHELSGRIG